MNKCSNCGAEFEGNFCPECGAPSDAPKTCPHCGAPVKPNAKFCNNCGYKFSERDASAPVAQPAQTAPKSASLSLSLQQNDVLYKILLFAPLAIFVLWAVLMFAFMAAPVMKGDLIGEDINVYGFFNAELLGGDEDLQAIVPAAAALVAFSVIAFVYAGWLAFVQFKGKKLTRWISQWASILLYVAVIICTSVIAVRFNAFADMSEMDPFALFAASDFDDMSGMGDFGDMGDFDDLLNIKGPFVGVTVAFTVVFMVLHVGALVACRLLNVGTLTAEERAEVVQKFQDKREQSRQKFNDWAQKRADDQEQRKKLNEYCAQRKKAVAKRLRTEPFIRGRAAGTMCVILLVCTVIGALFLSIANFDHAKAETNFDYFFELAFQAKETSQYSSTADDFSRLEKFWNSKDGSNNDTLRAQTESIYNELQFFHSRYEKEVGNGEKTFDEWLSEQTVYKFLSSYDYEEINVDPAILNTTNSKKISASELYDLGVEGYLKQRYPNGFADFAKEVTGESFTTEEEFRELCRSRLYDSYKQKWVAYPQFMILAVVILISSAAAIAFALLACTTTFRKRWKKSVIFCWIAIVCCFVNLVLGDVLFSRIAESAESNISLFGTEGAMRTLSLIVFIVGMLFGFISLFIQSADKRKTRKRWLREYDEQAAAEGNEIAQRMLQQNSRRKKSKRDRSSSQDDPE